MLNNHDAIKYLNKIVNCICIQSTLRYASYALYIGTDSLKVDFIHAKICDKDVFTP